MNSVTKSSSSMQEMLFENRNKEYGAYAIRTAYNDTVVKSLVMVASTLLLFIGSTYAYNNFFAEKIVAEEEGYDLKQQIVTVNLDPLEPQKPRTQAKSIYTPKTAAIATVINDNVNEDPEKRNLPLTTNPSNGTVGDTLPGDPIVGDPAGKGELPVIKVEKKEEAPSAFAEEMPEYPGGTKALMEYLSRSIVYPEKSRILGNEGTVFVNFVVGANGKVMSCKVLKGVDQDCNEEAMRVVSKMPIWKPGKNGGKEVPVMFNLPIRFKLN